VPDVFRRRGVNGILSDVLGIIANAFEGARNKDQVKITAQLLSDIHHPVGKLPVCIAIHFVELLVAAADRVRQLDAFLNIRVNAVLEH